MYATIILKIVRFIVPMIETLKMNHSKTIIEFSQFMYASLPLLLENRETRTIVRDMLQLFDPSLVHMYTSRGVLFTVDSDINGKLPQ